MAQESEKPKKAKRSIPERTSKLQHVLKRPFSTGLVDYALWIYMFQDSDDTSDKSLRRGRIWS